MLAESNKEVITNGEKMPSFTPKESDQKLVDHITEKPWFLRLVSQPPGCLRQYSSLNLSDTNVLGHMAIPHSILK